MNKILKGIKFSALAVMVAGLSGCNEPQHPVYGFTQLDPYLAIFVVFAVFAVGSFLWGVWSMIDFRKNPPTKAIAVNYSNGKTLKRCTRYRRK